MIGMIGMIIRFVLVGGVIRVVTGHGLCRMTRSDVASHAHTQHRVELAAAQRHRHSEEHRDEQPEWTAPMEHTSWEYIPSATRVNSRPRLWSELVQAWYGERPSAPEGW